MIRIAGVALFDGDKVLLQLRDNKTGIFFPNTWTIPGGLVNENEDVEKAAIREFGEETGYKCGKLKFFGEFPHGLKMFNVFLDRYDKKQKIGCFEGQKMEWINLNRFEELNLVPVARTILENLQKSVGV